MSPPDPRDFPLPSAAPSVARGLHALAEASLAAASGQVADAREAEIDAALTALLAGEGGAELAAVFDTAPSASIGRHLWRALARCFDAGAQLDRGLATTSFAMPLVLVAALDAPRETPLILPGVVDDTAALVATLREHRALVGNEAFALSGALCGADAFEFARMPQWYRSAQSDALAPLAPEPAPIEVGGTQESVHLRLLVGSALAAPGVDLLRDTRVGGWGVPLARLLAQQMAISGVTVLALPRAPQSPVTAVWNGRNVQREVSAQLFASNAIRKLRAAVGEPVAVVSAHRCDGVPGNGELRLSLSSPFDPRDAEGFRCPLYPFDRVGDVVAMLVDLMRDCRVTDIRTLAGVHPDRDPATGLTLLFKPESIPAAAAVTLH